MVKQSTKHVQLVLQRCCETIWITMFTYYHPHLDLSLQQIRLQVFFLGCKTRNIAIQLHLQQSCKTSCTFFIPVLQYLNKNCKHELSSELFGGKKHDTSQRGKSAWKHLCPRIECGDYFSLTLVFVFSNILLWISVLPQMVFLNYHQSKLILEMSWEYMV